MALVDHDYVVKVYRRLETGINPEIEIGRYLTEVAGFANTPALVGSVELVEGDHDKSAIAAVHAFVENQGDGWTVTAAYLDRFVDEQRVLGASEHPGESEEQLAYLRYMSQAGRRVAEMHLALAASDEIPDFAPEPTDTADVRRWIEQAMARAERAFDALKQRREMIREADRPLVDRLLAQRATLPDRLDALLPAGIDGLKIRHHGNFHLGQMLIVKDDIFIIDFAGEPHRPLEERRRKAPRRARRRRPDPLDRLLRHRRAGARAESGPRRARQARRGALGMARPLRRGVSRGLSRDHDQVRVCGRPTRQPPNGCSISSCSKDRSTRSTTNWPTGRTGCASR